jgi:nucleoside-diphosphate-sugar epimerase
LKIIITGASGWLGRNSIRYFLNNGLKLENLILIGSYNRELEIFKGLNVQIETFEEVIKSKKYSIIDGIVHLAYLTRDKIDGNVEKK